MSLVRRKGLARESSRSRLNLPSGGRIFLIGECPSYERLDVYSSSSTSSHARCARTARHTYGFMNIRQLQIRGRPSARPGIYTARRAISRRIGESVIARSESLRSRFTGARSSKCDEIRKIRGRSEEKKGEMLVICFPHRPRFCDSGLNAITSRVSAISIAPFPTRGYNIIFYVLYIYVIRIII